MAHHLRERLDTTGGKHTASRMRSYLRDSSGRRYNTRVDLLVTLYL